MWKVRTARQVPKKTELSSGRGDKVPMSRSNMEDEEIVILALASIVEAGKRNRFDQQNQPTSNQRNETLKIF